MKDRTLKGYIIYALLATIAIVCVSQFLPLYVTTGRKIAFSICTNYVIWFISLAVKDREMLTGAQKLKRAAYVLFIALSGLLALWLINNGLTWFVITTGCILYRYKISKDFYTWAYTGGVLC
jgi:hypothetical protein